jgi:hypothetical protein
MTSAASVQQSYRRDLTRYGSVVKIRRYNGTGPGRTYVDTPVNARVLGYEPAELVNTIQQGDRHLIVLAEDLILGGFAMPVTPSDKAIVRGKELAIVGVDDSTRRVGDVLIALDLQCRGG